MKKNTRKSSGQKSSRSKGKTKSKRQIKNARSLRDVLGMASGVRSGSRGTAAGPFRGTQITRRDKKTTPEAAHPPKLTYIMTFQPPPDVTEAERGQVVETRAKAHVEEASLSPAELHTRTDFRWPKERIVTASALEVESPRTFRGETLIEGIIKRHPDGFGFLIPDNPEHPDVYISRHSMNGIMTNDRVLVRVYKSKSGNKKHGDRLAGEIHKVISRGHTRIVGKYLPVDKKYGVILDEGRGWGADLRIASQDAMGAQEGDLVVAEILQYPDEKREFIGRVISLISNADDPRNDVIRVVHEAGIPNEFSATALAEARRFGQVVTEEEKKGREDLTHLPIITIDGVTARDFDDAIYVETTPKGFHLIVAIADVSHYVKPGTKLDQEAYERGTSTYFPNYVVPMLPEELSNELCSLKPGVDRLSFACEMSISYTGELESYRFFEAVICSQARVTYGEAQEVVDGTPPPSLAEKPGVVDNILRAADLAKILMQKRFREGSLDLEIPETQVVVDSLGETIDIIKAERLFAHRLIEELMLVTNIATARFLDNAGIPGVYRIHEEPDPDNIRALQRYLWNLGGHRSLMGSNLQKKISKALQSMEGRPEAQILHILTLRTMRQAHYSQENVGHFGLGFTHYTHFTSPIRRYPDLIAHRLIKSQLYPRYRSMQMEEEELASATTYLSACEQRSTKAERQVISIKKARFIRRFIGEEFDGIVSSVTKFGIFVLLRQYDVDGLIKLENLGNDRFVFDEENLRLIGTRRGVRYSIGDSIRVRVVGADPNQGRVDFELASEPVAETEVDEFDDDDFDNEQKRVRKKNEREGRGQQKRKSRDAEKRRSASNDRRRVRKVRVSKRRRKN